MSLDVFSLQNKVALVLGASNAVGRACALALAEAGADVAVATTLPSAQEEEALALCLAQLRDSAHAGMVEAVVRRTTVELGRLDILVNAHDLPYAKPATAMTPDEWRRVLDVNLTGPALACRAAAGPMLAQGSGRIINIVSLLGERGITNGSAYCAAQGGVLNLTRALALEWARSGVTINALGAGWTDGMGMIADEALKQQLARYIPQKRLAQPDEIGAAAVYLASDATGFITGQVIWIDGGVRSRL